MYAFFRQEAFYFACKSKLKLGEPYTSPDGAVATPDNYLSSVRAEGIDLDDCRPEIWLELYVVSKMVVSSRFGQQVSYFVLFSYRPSTHIVHDDSAVRWSTISLTTYWGSMFIRLFNTLKVIVYILYTMMEISH